MPAVFAQPWHCVQKTKKAGFWSEASTNPILNKIKKTSKLAAALIKSAKPS